MRAAGEHLVGKRSLCKWQDITIVRLKRAIREQRVKLVQCRTPHGPNEVMRLYVCFRGQCLVGRRHDGNQPAPWSDNIERPPLCFTANRIDDQVDGFDAQNEIPGLEVDHLVGAHFRAESDVARSAGGNHFRAYTMSELNNEIADGSGGAVDKDALATLRPAILEKHRPGRYGDDRHSAGFDEAKSHRLAR